jgi:outer membrane immunogenic protein
MKKFLLGSVALAAMIAGPAMAADMPLKAPPPVLLYSWTGCYVGGHVGGKASRADVTWGAVAVGAAAIPGSAVTDSIHLSGAVGGGQIGCQYQFAGGWLIGVEVDGSWTQSAGQSNILPPANTNFRVWVDEHNMATARGRLGYAWDKWMFFVTGGGAWANVEVSTAPIAFVIAGQQLGAVQTQSLSGWTAGFGAEYALGYGWSIKGEYLYMDFSNKTYFGTTIPAVLGEMNVHLRQSVARFGMNYKFDWGYGPVVARY